MDWQTVYEGSIWRIQQAKHQSGKTFEKAVRSPGSRLIIVRGSKVLLSREIRHELGNKTDYRLPGGKVFDTNEQYVAFLNTGNDIIEASRLSVVREGLQEVGVIIEPGSLTHAGVDVLGATCEWDLHYWICRDFVESQSGAEHDESEADEIKGCVWVEFSEARALALDSNQFAESRSARMLLSFLAEEIK